MSKRPSLAETMRQAAGTDSPQADVLTAKAKDEPASPTPRASGFHAATREGKKKVTAAIAPAAHKQLKGLAVERETTTEALLNEAIRDLFAKYGRPVS